VCKFFKNYYISIANVIFYFQLIKQIIDFLVRLKLTTYKSNEIRNFSYSHFILLSVSFETLFLWIVQREEILFKWRLIKLSCSILFKHRLDERLDAHNLIESHTQFVVTIVFTFVILIAVTCSSLNRQLYAVEYLYAVASVFL